MLLIPAAPTDIHVCAINIFLRTFLIANDLWAVPAEILVIAAAVVTLSICQYKSATCVKAVQRCFHGIFSGVFLRSFR